MNNILSTQSLNTRPSLLLLALALTCPSAWAATHDMTQMQHEMPMSGMDMGDMPMSHDMPTTTVPSTPAPQPMAEMDMGSMDHDMSGMDHSMHMPDSTTAQTPTTVTASPMAQVMPEMNHHSMPMEMVKTEHSMDHKAMPNMTHSMAGMQDMDMDMSGMQGGQAPANARDPFAVADGYHNASGHGQHRHTLGSMPMWSMAADRLEWQHNDTTDQAFVDASFWYGTDQNRLLLRTETAFDDTGSLDSQNHALWWHPISAFWNRELGVRYDHSASVDRTWLAAGINGTAPYWVDVSAWVYLGENGRTALKAEAEYDLRLTQNWVLQPRLEANAYGKSDPEQQIGSGLSNLESGLRLRYDRNRQIAPYLGLARERWYGNTADLRRQASEATSDTIAVLGLQLWY